MGIGSALLNYALFTDNYRQIHSVDQLCPLPPCKYIVCRTQNELMVRCLEKVIGSPYLQSRESKDASQVVAIIASNLGDKCVDTETLISRGIYGSALYGTSACVKSAEGLDFRRGDARYYVWRCNT